MLDLIFYSVLIFGNIYIIDVKTDEDEFFLLCTAQARHPEVLSDSVSPLPYKENRCVYLFSVESPIIYIHYTFYIMCIGIIMINVKFYWDIMLLVKNLTKR